MIVWTGIHKSVPCYRSLGQHLKDDKDLYSVPSIDFGQDEISHNEGTSYSSWTTPSIGTGDVKMMRDYAAYGYTLGVSLDDPSKEPELISKHKHHIMAYDIECEYMGPATSNIEASIMCVCLKCSCGYEVVVTRSKLHRLNCCQVVCRDNASMSQATVQLIMDHAPIFAIGHNVYEFDNRIACALPIDSPFRQFFLPTSSTLGSNVSNIGFIMTLPGINNLDTLTVRYIRKAMPQSFKSFALGNLAKDLGLSSQKIDNPNIMFELKWYTGSVNNAIEMVNYNMMDCQVTLDLCFKLDLINQMIALCNITKSYIIDVMLSSTGAIAASALCSYALRSNKKCLWTRCDYHPELLLGGHVHFKAPIVCAHPMIVDFVSMYPSIIASCHISPESIDFVDQDNYNDQRFDSRLCTMMSKRCNLGVGIAMTMYGLRQVTKSGCQSKLLVAKYCEWIDLDNNISQYDCQDMVSKKCICVAKSWFSEDTYNIDIPMTLIDIVIHKCIWHKYDHDANQVCDELMRSQCTLMLNYAVESKGSYNNIWIPQKVGLSEYIVDWELSPIGSEVILSMPGSVCKHTLGINMTSKVCQHLVSNRKRIKDNIKLLNVSGLSSTLSQDVKSQIEVANHLQWALKIAANSLYGCLAFREYNTYSPRCGASVTMIGRWSLHVALSIVQLLGCVVIYGDTDSVMFVVPDKDIATIKQIGNRQLSSNEEMSVQCLLPWYVNKMYNSSNISIKQCLEFMSGNNSTLDIDLVHYGWLKSCIPKIINRIMSYTCVGNLLLESQETGHKDIEGNDTFVFDKMIVLASKHYIARDSSGKMYSKGVSYVRRTGAYIQDEAAKRFSDIILSTSHMPKIVRALRIEYSKIVTEILRGKSRDIYRVRATRNAITRDYVKVIDYGPGNGARRYCDFGDFEEEFLDKEYYIGLVKNCLTSICKCMSLSDASLITGDN